MESFTNKTQHTAPNFIVIETFEREVISVAFCNTVEESIGHANEALKEHITMIGYECEIEGIDIENLQDDEVYFDEFAFASKKNMNAWCNLKDNWDATIIQLPQTRLGRCADCASLVETDTCPYFCDEYQKPCEDVEHCAEWEPDIQLG